MLSTNIKFRNVKSTWITELLDDQIPYNVMLLRNLMRAIMHYPGLSHGERNILRALILYTGVPYFVKDLAAVCGLGMTVMNYYLKNLRHRGLIIQNAAHGDGRKPFGERNVRVNKEELLRHYYETSKGLWLRQTKA